MGRKRLPKLEKDESDDDTRMWKGRKRMPKLEPESDDEIPAPAAKKAPRRKKLAKTVASSSKTEVPTDTEGMDPKETDTAAEEFESYVFDMWLRNENSAKFVQRLAQKATKAGAKGAEHIQKVGKEGTNNNMARDMKRKAKDKSKLTPPYYAGIPCWNDDESKCDIWDIPFFIPYELVWSFVQSKVVTLLTLVNIVAGTALAKIRDDICSRLQTDARTHVLFGLHSDGVPMQKSGASIEVQSFNFPNLPKTERSMWNVLEKMCVVAGVLVDILWMQFSKLCFGSAKI